MDYLFWAYTFVWILLFGYIFRLAIKQNRLMAEVRRLHNRLSEFITMSSSPPKQNG